MEKSKKDEDRTRAPECFSQTYKILDQLRKEKLEEETEDVLCLFAELTLFQLSYLSLENELTLENESVFLKALEELLKITKLPKVGRKTYDLMQALYERIDKQVYQNVIL